MGQVSDPPQPHVVIVEDIPPRTYGPLCISVPPPQNEEECSGSGT